MTTTEPPDDSYPSNWRPREAVERDRALDPTEAELWLGSLSPAELQATLKRARGPELTMRINTTLVSLADAQRLCAAVEGCGVTVPKTLSDVLQAHERLTAATSVANPTKKLVAAALDDRATADKVDQALERHALARLVAEERRGLDQHIQPESSSVRNFGTGSDSPAPALSNKRTRANVPSFSTGEPNSGMVQYSSTWLVNDPAQTSSTGPSPNT